MLRSDAFDLIVADINIGGGDPDFVIGQLCNVGAGVDIIICTPTPSLSQAVRAGQLGVCDYLDRSDLRTTLVALRDRIQRTGGEGSPSPARPQLRQHHL